jgi:hypothetical protein
MIVVEVGVIGIVERDSVAGVRVGIIGDKVGIVGKRSGIGRVCVIEREVTVETWCFEDKSIQE